MNGNSPDFSRAANLANSRPSADAPSFQEGTNTKDRHHRTQKERESQPHWITDDARLSIEIAERIAQEHDGEEHKNTAYCLVPNDACGPDDLWNHMLREFLCVTKLHASRRSDYVRQPHYVFMLARRSPHLALRRIDV